MPKIKYVYCDSCVFLAYFNAEPGRVEILDQLFEEIGKDDERKIVTSAFSVIEVAHIATEKMKRKLELGVEEKLDAFWSNTALLEMIDFHENLARKARSLMREAIEKKFSLKAADALHLASAQSIEVEEFYTYDDLSKFDEMTGLTICEPHVAQPRLF